MIHHFDGILLGNMVIFHGMISLEKCSIAFLAELTLKPISDSTLPSNMAMTLGGPQFLAAAGLPYSSQKVNFRIPTMNPVTR